MFKKLLSKDTSSGVYRALHGIFLHALLFFWTNHSHDVEQVGTEFYSFMNSADPGERYATLC